MNATHTKDPEGDDAFLNLVDFKWLMAGVGWWVDLSRLQSDRGYIDECLQRALKSDSELLRKRSVKLLGLRHGSGAYLDAAMPRAFTALAL
jgi:HEAT repeat protein